MPLILFFGEHLYLTILPKIHTLVWPEIHLLDLPAAAEVQELVKVIYPLPFAG